MALKMLCATESAAGSSGTASRRLTGVRDKQLLLSSDALAYPPSIDDGQFTCPQSPMHGYLSVLIRTLEPHVPILRVLAIDGNSLDCIGTLRILIFKS
jgi:hypothetical protein